MCGIAGLVLTPPGPVQRRQIDALLRSLEHRGPDDAGVLSLRQGEVRLGRKALDEDVVDAVLVHRRLAILDLSAAGWQPMGTPDGRYFIVFNGEIYNYVELRSELEGFGYQFRSRSDTEVLLAAYVHWGPQALSRLIGMFAFVILDMPRRTLFIARDCFGIKPLYYAYWRDGFAFTSEIKALLELPGINCCLNPQRLYDFLRFGITDIAGETLLLGVKQLPAAHYMEVPLDNPQAAQMARYWQIDFSRREELSFAQAASRLQELFLENVRLHLRSDVPIGAALSGGIDSSSIVMAARYLEKDLNIHTFSYIADSPEVSEERWVDIVSQAANTRVHKVMATPEQLVKDMDHLTSVQEESFGGTSIYAQYQVFKQAHQAGIKVMLDGQGADELLGGYHYYIAARLGSLIRQGRWAEGLRLLRSASRFSGLSRGWLGLRAMDFLLPSGVQIPLRRLIKKDLAPRWLNMAWFKHHGIRPRSVGYRKSQEVLKESLYQELVEVSLPRLLRFEDRNSMAFSIESRVPFLTPALVNFIFALPEEYLIAPDGTTKAVFRRAMRGIVPDVILDRKDKIGFATPEKGWLFALRPWVERMLTSDAARQIQAINLQEAQKEWQNIVQGRRPFGPHVWRWMSMILAVQKFGAGLE